MSLRRLYCPELAQGRLTLPPDEAHHGATVLRLRPNDRVSLFDGRGGVAEAVVERATRRELVVTAAEVVHQPFELPIRLTLAVALPRAHRASYLIEKCTELGVFEFVPILARRRVVELDEHRTERLERRVIEACKQCHRAWLPRVCAPVSLSDILRETSANLPTAIADASATGVPWLTWLEATALTAGKARVLVGPEGGWADAERAQAAECGVPSVSLGPFVLRTETAAIAACSGLALLCRPAPPPGATL